MNAKTTPISLFFALLPFLFNGQSAPRLPPSQLRQTLETAQKIANTNLDSALAITGRVLENATALDSVQLMFRAHRIIGMILSDHNDYAAARDAYAKAMSLAAARLPLHDQLNAYNDWAIVHKKTGDFKVAREYHQRAIGAGEKAGDWEIVENGWHGMATMYSMMSDFDKSVQCYLSSIEAAKKRGNAKGVVLSQQNIANVYLKAKNYPMAQQNIQTAYQMAQTLGDSMRMATVCKIWGNIHTGQGQLDSALAMHQAALRIFEKNGNKPQQSESWLSLVDIHIKQQKLAEAAAALTNCAALEAYFSPYSHATFHQLRGKLRMAQNKPHEAIMAFQTSLEKTEKFGFKEIARDNHLLLAQQLHLLHRDAEAIEHAFAANQLNEGVFEVEKQKNMTDAQFKYDLAQRDFQIETQQKELRQSDNMRLALFIGFLVACGLAFFAFREASAKQKALRHGEMLMKELHHRVKNNLQIITSIMRLQSRKISDPNMLAILNESRSRLETISMLHQQLYQNEHVKSVNLKEFILELFEKLRFTYNMDDVAFDFDIAVVPENMDVDIALPLALIVNELFTNSFKYAFADNPAPSIRLSIVNRHLHYADNGPGFPVEHISKNNKTLGYQLIASLTEQLKSKFEYYNQDGLHFELELKQG